MTESTKGLLVFTGANRGIGAALERELSKNFEILSLTRQRPKSENELYWDLSIPPSKEQIARLQKAVVGKNLQGFLHCAGVLGPVGPTDNSTHWNQFQNAFRVNCVAGLELIELLRPYFSRKARSPFAFHLTSGAALNAYPGWDAYCASKAAMYMAFICLSQKHPSEELTCVSVAPGTVMTDMMRTVLQSDPAHFPAVSKFHKLKENNELVSPESVAAKISQLLNDHVLLKDLHGKFYDLRKGIVD